MFAFGLANVVLMHRWRTYPAIGRRKMRRVPNAMVAVPSQNSFRTGAASAVGLSAISPVVLPPQNGVKTQILKLIYFKYNKIHLII